MLLLYNDATAHDNISSAPFKLKCNESKESLKQRKSRRRRDADSTRCSNIFHVTKLLAAVEEHRSDLSCAEISVNIDENARNCRATRSLGATITVPVTIL